MNSIIEKHQHDLAVLCHKFLVKQLDLFGSAVTNQFNPQSSDVDLVEIKAINNPYFLKALKKTRTLLYAA